MNSYKKLISNTFIFALGNLGTKLITFFLVPLYTYYLTTSEYGLTDLITSTVSLLLPIFTLSIFDAVLRFVMDKNYDNKVILNNALIIAVIGFIIILTILSFFKQLLPFGDYLSFFFGLLFIQAVQAGLGQYVRAQGKIRLFAINGIFNALMILLCNILFLVWFNLGIIGYLLSYIVGYTISSIFLMFGGEVWKDISPKKVNFNITKEMLCYSIPLIPNSFMWWIIDFSNRYVITNFLGLSANGIFAVSSKIPSLLNVVYSIFFQAWQMSAIEEYESKDKSNFYSNVFNIFSFIMFLATSVILFLLKIIISILVEESYFEAWKYVPFLLLGIVFSSFSGFLGTNYIAAKRTGGVFKSSVIGAIVNIVVLFLLVPIIGINGASIATMMSFFTMWVIRIIDTKEYVDIKMDWKKLFLNIVVIIIQIGVLYTSFKLNYVIQTILVLVLCFINQGEIKQIIKLVQLILYRRKQKS
ncbi:lipopolysaccharide biosynthesis protein [Caldibacillus thermoamylovorans]|uniref:lipopolysaccharide biosynthesis protein n=1 Tax=Caldibacillus thermoamylovorans TaxID=35841 RepID=UPI0022E3648C|nr:polysaccharide biosynthesis C-terminal domain-containing protein [Caldibacillus thermoamylovorans]